MKIFKIGFLFMAILGLIFSWIGCKEDKDVLSSSEQLEHTSDTHQQGNFDIGDMTEVSEDELRQLVCEKVKECDPAGYENLVDTFGECKTEVDQLLELCIGYISKNAAQCLKIARLSDLSDFRCEQDDGTQPEICLHICESYRENDGPATITDLDEDTNFDSSHEIDSESSETPPEN